MPRGEGMPLKPTCLPNANAPVRELMLLSTIELMLLAANLVSSKTRLSSRQPLQALTSLVPHACLSSAGDYIRYRNFYPQLINLMIAGHEVSLRGSCGWGGPGAPCWWATPPLFGASIPPWGFSILHLCRRLLAYRLI